MTAIIKLDLTPSKPQFTKKDSTKEERRREMDEARRARLGCWLDQDFGTGPWNALGLADGHTNQEAEEWMAED